MVYYVTFAVDARFVAEIEANDIEEAIDLATDRFCDADFGDAEDIEGDAIIVENESGNFVWER